MPGTVSVWCGRLGSPVPAYARRPDLRHYAASTVKLAILAALYRVHEAGRLDLDGDLPVRNRFRSALPGAPGFALSPGRGDVWARVGGRASLRWLAYRMIVRSDNLAGNL